MGSFGSFGVAGGHGGNSNEGGGSVVRVKSMIDHGSTAPSL